MRITQGMFSFLPDLTDDQIAAQIRWFIDQGWAVSVEFTDDPHPRNTYWEMWGQPMFDLTDPAPVMTALDRCRAATPDQYVRLVAFDARKGYETVRASFIVQRPGDEPGFHTVRAAGTGRTVRYSTHAYATDRPAGGRYR